MNKREIGTVKEQLAAAFLVENGFEILERNFRGRRGEIDLVAMKAKELHFIEVKYRKNTAYGYPAEAVNLRKQMTICKVSDYYRYFYQYNERVAVHYDVIAILGTQLSFIQDAYDYC